MSDATILVPLDFSDCSHSIAKAARDRARSTGARIVYLHVLQVPHGIGADVLVQPSPGTEPLRLGDHMQRRAEEILETFVAEARAQGLPAEAKLVTGRAADAIVGAAHEVGANAIFMGTHGRHGVAKLLLGSVSDKVQKQSDIEVVRVASEHRDDCEANSCNWCADAGLFRDQVDIPLA